MNRSGAIDISENLSSQVRAGAAWAGARAVIPRVVNVVVMMIVARLVTPEDLGLVAVSLAVYGMLVSVADVGVATALARSDIDADEVAPTVHTLSIGCSALVGGGVFLLAEPIANVLDAPDAAVVIQITALALALIGPFATPGALLQREFRQDLLFRATTIGFVPGTLVLIGLAAAGLGASAFAWAIVVGQLVTGLLVLHGEKLRYWPGFDRRIAGSLLRFGIPLASANLLSQVLLNVDYVVIARTLTVEDVGIYMLAFNVAMWPTAVLSAVLNGVVMPAFSRVRTEGGDVDAALRSSVQLVALVAFPIAAVTASLSEPLIRSLYGDKWSASASTLTVLAGYGALTVVCLLLANIIIATGRTTVLMVIQIVALVILMPAMTVGARMSGVDGVALTHVGVVALVTLPVSIWAIRRSLSVGPTSVLVPLLAPAAFAAAAATAGFLGSQFFASPIMQLLVGL
ncbi:MAG: oligosaccharide flippase family protein [Aldersonia sp.]|nr:oligosaccharide flippase family protein [Aldersonia sp.]